MNELRNPVEPQSQSIPKRGLAGFQGQKLREGMARNRQDEENELQNWWQQQDQDEEWIDDNGQ